VFEPELVGEEEEVETMEVVTEEEEKELPGGELLV
jgi:hypothetical protein